MIDENVCATGVESADHFCLYIDKNRSIFVAALHPSAQRTTVWEFVFGQKSIVSNSILFCTIMFCVSF